MLYQPNTEFARLAEEFAHDFQAGHPDRQLDLVSLDTLEGSNMAEVYDIVQYPAILVLNDAGELLKYWSGEPLPLMNEVAAYSNSPR